MSLFEIEEPLLYEENLGVKNNFMDNPLYSPNPWSTSANAPFGENLFPPLQPRAITKVDRGDQYVNPFIQPHVPNRPLSVRGQNFPPMNYAYTQTDPPIEGQVIPTT